LTQLGDTIITIATFRSICEDNKNLNISFQNMNIKRKEKKKAADKTFFGKGVQIRTILKF